MKHIFILMLMDFVGVAGVWPGVYRPLTSPEETSGSDMSGKTRRPSNLEISTFPTFIIKGLRLTAGRRPTWVCVGLGRAHVKLSGAYTGPWWCRKLVRVGDRGPILSKVKLSGAHLGPRLGQVGPMWSMLGTLAYVGLCWAYVGPMLAYVGPMLSHLGGYVGHILGICWLSWAYVEDMLGNVSCLEGLYPQNVD